MSQTQERNSEMRGPQATPKGTCCDEVSHAKVNVVKDDGGLMMIEDGTQRTSDSMVGGSVERDDTNREMLIKDENL